jgi:hypothetical protein
MKLGRGNKGGFVGRNQSRGSRSGKGERRVGDEKRLTGLVDSVEGRLKGVGLVADIGEIRGVEAKEGRGGRGQR